MQGQNELAVKLAVTKEMLTEQTLETNRLMNDLRTRDRLLVAVLATVGPVEFTDEAVMEVNDGAYVGVDYQYEDGVHKVKAVRNPELEVDGE